MRLGDEIFIHERHTQGHSMRLSLKFTGVILKCERMLILGQLITIELIGLKKHLIFFCLN